jgi:hypothetical protein
MTRTLQQRARPHRLADDNTQAGGGRMIKKVKEGYKVVSEKSGKNLGGPYKTKEQAKDRLRQVEFFKRKKR